MLKECGIATIVRAIDDPAEGQVRGSGAYSATVLMLFLFRFPWLVYKVARHRTYLQRSKPLTRFCHRSMFSPRLPFLCYPYLG